MVPLLVVEQHKPGWIMKHDNLRFFGDYTEHGLLHIYMECPFRRVPVFILRQTRKEERWFVQCVNAYPDIFIGLSSEQAVMRWYEKYYEQEREEQLVTA